MGHNEEKRVATVVAKMIGQKFGLLTVTNHHSRARGYNCCCDCGNTTIVRTWALKTGRQFSCGCAPRRLKRGHEPAQNEVYKNYKQAADRRGHDFKLTKDEFCGLIACACHYCGSPPSLLSPLPRHPEFRFNGVDRVDNTKGYLLDNCVPCCAICNRSKSVLALDEWLAWVKRVHDFQFGEGK
jgi:hypothetical protein